MQNWSKEKFHLNNNGRNISMSQLFSQSKVHFRSIGTYAFIY